MQKKIRGADNSIKESEENLDSIIQRISLEIIHLHEFTQTIDDPVLSKKAKGILKDLYNA